jgi:hypothetical protein
MVLESSISVVFLFGVFVLGVWMALVPEPRWVNDGASLFDAWHVEARAALVSATGYLVWSGTEWNSPATLTGEWSGTAYTWAFASYFGYVLVRRSTLYTSRAAIGTEPGAWKRILRRTPAEFILWGFFFVIGICMSQLWSGESVAQRWVAFGFWIGVIIIDVRAQLRPQIVHHVATGLSNAAKMGESHDFRF